MIRPCRDIETSLGRPLGALNEAERLVLEHHLAECAECRQTNRLARTIHDMIESAPAGLAEHARERAIRSALDRGARAASLRPAGRRTRWLGAGLAAAVLLAIGLRFASVERERDGLRAQTKPIIQRTPEAAREPSAQPALAAEQPTSADDDTEKDAWIAVASAETRRFGNAQVELAAGTQVRFQREQHTLELAQGQVTVDVDPRPGSPFFVVTHSFRVEVLGTQFVVTPERVDVLRGRVQVRALDGAWPARELSVGESFRNGESSHPKAARTKLREQSPAASTVPAREPAAALLRQARTALGNDDPASARALIERAEPLARSNGERAEAGTLRAECALLERHTGLAIDAYLAVFQRFAELPAGENALFAAAQLCARERETTRARGLLELYVSRYPSGRFVDEARARLSKLAR